MNWQLTWSAASHVTGWYAALRRLDGHRPASDWCGAIDDATTELARPLSVRALPIPALVELLRDCISAWSEVPGQNANATLDADAPIQQAAAVEALENGISRRPATDLHAINFSTDETKELTARLIQVARTFAARWPRLAEELPLRAGPLREQWEARGPGLLRRVQRLWHDDWRIDAARIALVYPVFGGGGVALSGSVVAFEAMLYNGVSALPEILRLGWLLAQLPGLIDGSPEHTMSDLPLPYEEFAPRQRLALALLPVVLDAGEYVELSRNDGATLRLALGAWCGFDGPTAERLGMQLETWWRTRQANRAPA